MLKYRLTHPDLIGVLAGMGHGGQILLADGNYPVDVLKSGTARTINLNIRPGLIGALDILELVVDAVPVEAAHFMLMDDGHAPPIATDFRRFLPAQASLDGLPRADFYTWASDQKTSVVVATGEQALFANLVITIGYMRPDGSPNF